jgi:hypothetical protein
VEAISSCGAECLGECCHGINVGQSVFDGLAFLLFRRSGVSSVVVIVKDEPVYEEGGDRVIPQEKTSQPLTSIGRNPGILERGHPYL